MLPASSPLLVGWCGLLGLIFLLHFGTFHSLALTWQSLGVNARPLMRAPIVATSPSEFWGQRWNSAFSALRGLTVAVAVVAVDTADPPDVWR